MKGTVIVSAPKYYGIDTDIRESFESMGFRTLLFNYRIKFTILETFCRIMGIKLSFLKPILNPVIKFYLARENRKFINDVRKENPDLLFIVKGDHLFPETLEELKRVLPCTIVAYVWDDPFYTDKKNLQDDYRRSNFKKSIHLYDYIFVFDTFYIDEIQKRGAKHVSYLPLATNPERYKRIRVTEEDRKNFSHDICFIGVPFPNRVELFESLRDYDLGVYGDQWKKYFTIRGKKVPSYYKGKATGDTVNKIYLCSRIVLNIHHPHSIEGLNTRTFDIPACGAFEITDYKKNIERHFELDKEVVAFKDMDELRRKIDYYLKHDEVRKSVSEMGKKRVLDDHTWRKRMVDVIAVVEESNRDISASGS